MTPDGSEQLALPGVVPPVRDHDSAMVKAAVRSLAELERSDRLGVKDAVLVALVVQLAGAIDAGTRSGRASAVAMAARELRETMLVLDPPPEDGDAGAEALRRWREFMDTVERAANGEGTL